MRSQDTDELNPIRRAAFRVGLLLIFLRFSLIHELFTLEIGVNTRILYVVGPLAMLGVLLTGGFGRAFRSRTAVYWTLFAIWMVFAIPFSVWPGGAFNEVWKFYKTELPMLFVMAGLAVTWSDCRAIINTIGFSAVINLATGKLLAKAGSERFSLEGLTIANSNDFSAHLLLVAPFFLFFMLSGRHSNLVRVAAFLSTSAAFFMILATGSRGAFLALIVSILFIVSRGTGKQRLFAFLIVPSITLVSYMVIPRPVMNRLLAITDSSETLEDAALQEAVMSKQLRTSVLRKSIQYTIHNPLVGVGPGQFIVYDNEISQKDGKRRGNWIQTHNVYTQVSSECGIPALILYLAGIFSTFGLLYKTNRRARRDPKFHEIALATFCAMISLVGLCTAIVFLTIPYKFYLPVMASMAIAFHASAQREFAKAGVTSF